MNKKPFYNAILAAGYISLVVSCISLTAHMPHPPEDNMLIPIGMLSLLVLSVSVMAFLFFYQPVLLLIEKKHVEAAKFLATTIGIFAVLTAIFFTLALFFIP